jgi:uncharacterized protein YbjT (DUF2867 family)
MTFTRRSSNFPDSHAVDSGEAIDRIAALAASPRTDVNALTGEGLADVLTDAGVVVEVANAPTFDADPVMEFFTTSTTNLLAAARNTGVGHSVAAPIVGCDQMPESGYMRAKAVQEKLIERAGIPYSIVRATQFVEFNDTITASLTVGEEVRVPDALIQPITTADLAEAVARVAEAAPIDGIENVGGPAKITFEQMARDVLAKRGENETVVVDPQATYFGAPLSTNSLVVP